MNTELTTMTPDEIKQIDWCDLTVHGASLFETYNEALETGVLSVDNVDTSQECFLGYSPATGSFWSAHDAWFGACEDDGFDECGNVLEFRIIPTVHGVMVVRGAVVHASRMFYSKGYKELRQNIPDLIDLRLD